MKESMDQVRNTVLSLPYQDRLRLMHLLLDDLSEESEEDLTEGEMAKIDTVLQQRLKGPFGTIDNVKEWTKDNQNRFEARAEALIASENHG